MEKRAAFSRALGFLNFKPAAQWIALIGTAGTGVLTVALLLVLGLVADLLVYRGQVPVFADLSPEERERFQQVWRQRTPAEWDKILLKFGFDAESASQLTAERSEPIPPEQLAQRWQAFVYELLIERTGSEAAHLYRDTRSAGQDYLGILGLVVRSREYWYGRPLGWLAAWAPWTWRSSAADPSNFAYLSGLAGLALFLALVRSLLRFGGHYGAAIAVTEAALRMRRAVYHHTYRLGTLAIRSLGPSEAVGVFTLHLEAVADALHAWLTVAVRAPTTFVLLLAFACLVHFWLTLTAIVSAALAGLIVYQLSAYFQAKEDRANRHSANRLVLLQESLMLMRLVKGYLMEIFNQGRVEEQLTGYQRWQLRRARSETVFRSLLAFLGLLAGILLLFLTGLIVLEGQLSVPGGIVLAAALAGLVSPALAWWEYYKLLLRGRESALILFKFLDRPGEVGQVARAEVLPPLAKRLEFDNVTLREPGSGRVLLQEVSFAIPAGTRVALAGPDDIDKHALIYLLVRFLDPTTGEIRIDDHNLRWIALESLRKQVALVLQHNLVFNDTVSNNIRCGDAGIKLPRIIEAAKLAHAHQFIQKLPRGYETTVGEMGHSLTIGEQYRIALARAILRNPALLILEEPPAFHLDEDTQDLLDDTLDRVLPGRTVFVLAHRRATLERCNQVFLLHKGKLVARGEHQELLKQNDMYRHLHYMEFNPFAGQL